MSITFYVHGIKLPDGKWKKMKAVWEACVAAETEPPPEVRKFFGDDGPDDKGVVIRLETNNKVCSKYIEEMCTGYEVNLAELDPAIKIIRFVVSY